MSSDLVSVRSAAGSRNGHVAPRPPARGRFRGPRRPPGPVDATPLDEIQVLELVKIRHPEVGATGRPG